MNNQQPTIGILVFPETTASVVYGLYDMFLAAGRDWGIIVDGEESPELLKVLLVARSLEPVAICNGVSITPQTTMADCPPLDVICVPEVALAPGTALSEQFAAEIDWLKQIHAQGSALASACSGAMLFAEAGLLNGCDATTHWAWCDTLKQQFPKIKVHPQRALVVTGEGQRLIMAGGGSTWLDLALYIIARTLDVNTAMHVARINLIDWHEIGQLPFARLARTRQVSDAVISSCQVWIAEHYDEPNPVANMIRLSGLVERTFKRRFQQATGMSPLEYVQALRLEEAKHMLETTDLPIEAIANEVGYEDAGFFSRLFKRKIDLTPAQYRKRFGSLRQSLVAR